MTADGLAGSDHVERAPRVLQVLPSIVPGGGSEQSLAMLAPLLVDRGIDLHLVYFDRGGELVDELRADGVTVHDRSGAPRRHPNWALRLRSLIREVRPDIVHSTLFDADIATRIATPLTGSRVLTTWAGTPYDPVRSRLEPGHGGWKRQLVRGVDMATAHLSRSWFHAVTAGVADAGIAGLHVRGDRVVVVERGRDLRRFRPPSPAERFAARDAMGVEPEDTVVMMVARETHVKGHVHLVQALDRLGRDCPSLRVVLIGPSGPATPAIQRALSEGGYLDRVIRLGERRDVDVLLRGADLFVLASVAEGAAGSMIEAMATGVPVIATRLAGLRGSLEDGEHALLAAPGDSDDLARAMTEALSDPDATRKRAERARAHAVDRFSLESCADGMAALYRDLSRKWAG